MILDSLWAMPVLQLAAGESHSAALTSNGFLFTWGNNDCGQLGLPTVADVAVTVRPRLQSQSTHPPSPHPPGPHIGQGSQPPQRSQPQEPDPKGPDTPGVPWARPQSQMPPSRRQKKKRAAKAKAKRGQERLGLQPPKLHLGALTSVLFVGDLLRGWLWGVVLICVLAITAVRGLFSPFVQFVLWVNPLLAPISFLAAAETLVAQACIFCSSVSQIAIATCTTSDIATCLSISCHFQEFFITARFLLSLCMGEGDC